MKGTITIEATEDGLHITGGILLTKPRDRYEIIRALCLSLRIDSPDAFAELISYCLPRLNDKERTSRTIMIPIPKKKEDNRGGET